MTKVSRTIVTNVSNPEGVLEYVMFFGLQQHFKSNVKSYIYKYDVNNLIEICYNKAEDVLHVFEFAHSPTGSSQIIEMNVDFYMNYFKSVGLLEGKRFLFDVNLKLPVNYNDFIYNDQYNLSSNRSTAFILDAGNGYITGARKVLLFIATELAMAVDSCVFAFMVNSMNFKRPAYRSKEGIMFLCFLSGLLMQVDDDKLEEQLEKVNIVDKLIKSSNDMEYYSEYVNNARKYFNVDRLKGVAKNVVDDDFPFKELVEKEVQDSNRAYLSNIIDMGLDKFIRTSGTTGIIKVVIDTAWQEFKGMYISNGAAFITPGNSVNINHYKDLLNSDNVVFVMS